jgi:hypothetical protein
MIFMQRFKIVAQLMFMTLLSVSKFTWGEARGSVVGWGTMLQAGRLWVQFPMRLLDFLVDLFLPAALRPWVRLSL